MNFIGIVPSRYASFRFPGKPLAEIQGKKMIERVYEQAGKVLEHLWVATDDKRIADEVSRFGGKVVMTSKEHASGTDRVARRLTLFSKKRGFNLTLLLIFR